MSYADKLKEELCHLPLDDQAECRSEYLGFVKSRGTLRLRGNTSFLVIPLTSITSLKRLFQVSKRLSIPIFETQVIEEVRLGRKRGGELSYLYGEVEEFLRRSGISVRDDSIPRPVREDPVYFGAFLRGLYLAGGSVVDPSKEYHLEITLDTTEAFVNSVREYVSENFNIKVGVVKVREKFKAYVKSSMDIIELLSLMGGKKTVTRLSSAIEVRRIRSDVSRTLNFLTANANKSGQAMAKHVRAIRIIDKKLGIENLEEDLQLVAILRLENEDLNLRELGEIMNPPMSKSAVYNRLKKLMALAEELGDN
ncbi:MAG: DNA-binding protein WhiA [Kosmotogaceae bacterium]|nr:DNA-binding protein WhiA [Kosmotogaceae bacterium]